MAGGGSDMRDVEKAALAGDEDALLASVRAKLKITTEATRRSWRNADGATRLLKDTHLCAAQRTAQRLDDADVALCVCVCV